MSTYKVSYTKVFVPGSILEGLKYVETTLGSTRKGMTEIEVSLLIEWAQRHEVIPVNACGGSNYTVENVTVTVLA